MLSSICQRSGGNSDDGGETVGGEQKLVVGDAVTVSHLLTQTNSNINFTQRATSECPSE